MPEPGWLIDTAALGAASEAGGAERYGRGETAHAVHTWWARRPHSAMRALVFACLCEDQGPDAEALLSRLAACPVPDPALLQEAEARVLRPDGARPRVLDLFGGSGTIALEALNLGADAASVDTNELAVFIQRSQLVGVPAERVPELAEEVERAGRRALDRLRARTDPLFPLRASEAPPVAYLWTWVGRCEGCGYRLALSRRPWLSRAPGRGARLLWRPGPRGDLPRVVAAEPSPEREPAPRLLRCPRCEAEHRPSVRRARERLVAVVRWGERAGKVYGPPSRGAAPSLAEIRAFERAILAELQLPLPRGRLPRWSGVINPPLHGLERHAELLGPRQRALLLALILELRREHAELAARLPAEEARFVLSALSALVDQLVDWNSRLSVWIPENEQVGRALCGPGLAMRWDHAETDPLLDGPANLHDRLTRVVAGLRTLDRRRGVAEVRLADARRLPWPDAHFDAVVTDPPYFDNLPYSALADVIFAWKRLLLGTVEPLLFGPEATAGGGARELGVSVARAGGEEPAARAYEEGLGAALAQGARLLRPEGRLCLIFGHGALRAWVGLARALRGAGLRVTRVEPLALERRARPRAHRSEAVHTTFALVARRGAPAPALTPSLFDAQLAGIFEGPAAARLQAEGWSGGELGLALFVEGAALLARHAGVEGRSDEEALRAVLLRARQLSPALTLRERRSL